MKNYVLSVKKYGMQSTYYRSGWAIVWVKLKKEAVSLTTRDCDLENLFPDKSVIDVIKVNLNVPVILDYSCVMSASQALTQSPVKNLWWVFFRSKVLCENK